MSQGTLYGREPVAILFAVMAVIQVAIAFGLSISAEQLGLLNVALAAIFSVITRSQVSPV
ncbi:MAG: hypothetical protein GEU73_05170 [Chloroflexi bacterium]|nr:hypothetical protein [Chloroflexota bacterium]